eukprot:TRINITY_DN3375_c2_g1_i2.p1 TRINITY_DN3375_c2_g1~~TRINITY_DN3375_c2_g1_i2.p1  ORF type:complete len:2183 (+),score=420.83 TRINITY_DN3375_c2_g1_i2:1304-7852(+)
MHVAEAVLDPRGLEAGSRYRLCVDLDGDAEAHTESDTGITVYVTAVSLPARYAALPADADAATLKITCDASGACSNESEALLAASASSCAPPRAAPEPLQLGADVVIGAIISGQFVLTVLNPQDVLGDPAFKMTIVRALADIASVPLHFVAATLNIVGVGGGGGATRRLSSAPGEISVEYVISVPYASLDAVQPGGVIARLADTGPASFAAILFAALRRAGLVAAGEDALFTVTSIGAPALEYFTTTTMTTSLPGSNETNRSGEAFVDVAPQAVLVVKGGKSRRLAHPSHELRRLQTAEDDGLNASAGENDTSGRRCPPRSPAAGALNAGAAPLSLASTFRTSHGAEFEVTLDTRCAPAGAHVALCADTDGVSGSAFGFGDAGFEVYISGVTQSVGAGAEGAPVVWPFENQELHLTCAASHCSEVSFAYLALECDTRPGITAPTSMGPKRSAASKFIDLVSREVWKVTFDTRSLAGGVHYRLCTDLDGPGPDAPARAGDTGMLVYASGVSAIMPVHLPAASDQTALILCSRACSNQSDAFLALSCEAGGGVNGTSSIASPTRKLARLSSHPSARVQRWEIDLDTADLLEGRNYRLCVDGDGEDVPGMMAGDTGLAVFISPFKYLGSSGASEVLLACSGSAECTDNSVAALVVNECSNKAFGRDAAAATGSGAAANFTRAASVYEDPRWAQAVYLGGAALRNASRWHLPLPSDAALAPEVGRHLRLCADLDGPSGETYTEGTAVMDFYVSGVVEAITPGIPVGASETLALACSSGCSVASEAYLATACDSTDHDGGVLGVGAQTSASRHFIPAAQAPPQLQHLATVWAAAPWLGNGNSNGTGAKNASEFGSGIRGTAELPNVLVAPDVFFVNELDTSSLAPGVHYRLCTDLDGSSFELSAGDTSLQVYVSGVRRAELVPARGARVLDVPNRRLSLALDCPSGCSSSSLAFLATDCYAAALKMMEPLETIMASIEENMSANVTNESDVEASDPIVEVIGTMLLEVSDPDAFANSSLAVLALRRTLAAATGLTTDDVRIDSVLPESGSGAGRRLAATGFVRVNFRLLVPASMALVYATALNSMDLAALGAELNAQLNALGLGHMLASVISMSVGEALPLYNATLLDGNASGLDTYIEDGKDRSEYNMTNNFTSAVSIPSTSSGQHVVVETDNDTLGNVTFDVPQTLDSLPTTTTTSSSMLLTEVDENASNAQVGSNMSRRLEVSLEPRVMPEIILRRLAEFEEASSPAGSDAAVLAESPRQLATAAPTVDEVLVFEWIGCFYEDGDHDLDGGPQAFGFTSETCAAMCKGFRYIALRQNGYCSCGQSFQNEDKYYRVSNEECGTPCDGEETYYPTRYCGGTWRNAVYQIEYAHEGKLFIGDYASSMVRRSRLDGSGLEDFLDVSPGRPYGVAVDIVRGKVYIVVAVTNVIIRVNVDGTGRQQLISGLSEPAGIALDTVRGRMYYPDYSVGSIYVAGLEGEAPSTFHSCGTCGPIAVDVDALAGKVYWTDAKLMKLRRANSDGTGVEDLAAVVNPFGVSFDAQHKVVYVVEQSSKSVRRLGVDGAQPAALELVVSTDPAVVADVVVDPLSAKLYMVTIGTPSQVLKATLDGGVVRAAVPGGLVTPLMMAAEVRQRLSQGMLRLADASTLPYEREGRLEIFLDGQWGTVCNRSFTDIDAEVACRQLGHSEGGTFLGNTGVDLVGYGPVLIADVACNGTEKSFIDCGYFDVPAVPPENYTETCFHENDVRIACQVSHSTFGYDYRAVGCFRSSGLIQGPDSYGYTVETCRQACRSYAYFALTDFGRCSCSSENSTFVGQQVADSECGSHCPGEKEPHWNGIDDVPRPCGSYLRSAIFEHFFSPSTTTTTPNMTTTTATTSTTTTTNTTTTTSTTNTTTTSTTTSTTTETTLANTTTTTSTVNTTTSTTPMEVEVNNFNITYNTTTTTTTSPVPPPPVDASLDALLADMINCTLAARGPILTVYYNGKDISNVVEGDLANATQLKALSFKPLPGAFLTFALRDDEEQELGDSCRTSGFWLQCDNGLSTNSVGWEAWASHEHPDFEHRNGVGDSWHKPCVSPGVEMGEDSPVAPTGVRSLWATYERYAVLRIIVSKRALCRMTFGGRIESVFYNGTDRTAESSATSRIRRQPKTSPLTWSRELIWSSLVRVAVAPTPTRALAASRPSVPRV